MKGNIMEMGKKIVVYMVSFLLAVNPMLVHAADGIRIDANAPINFQPGIRSTEAGIPQVDITTPTSSGTSQNRFTDYNVGQEGVVINNSMTGGVSQIGGKIAPNFNLKGRNASTVIIDVNGGDASKLNGPTEMFGGPAALILSNPYGVSCNGCGFINTPKVEINTKNSDGTITGGKITIEERTDKKENQSGLDASQVDELKLNGGKVDINDSVVVKGKLDIESNGSATSQGEYAIDAKAVGAMQAGQIKIMATGNGVGVKLDGDMVAFDGDLNISSKGDIKIKGVTASKKDTVIHADGNIEKDSDTIAIGNADFKANNITTHGAYAVGNNVYMQAANDLRLKRKIEDVTPPSGNAGNPENNGSGDTAGGSSGNNSGDGSGAGGNSQPVQEEVARSNTTMVANDVALVAGGVLENEIDLFARGNISLTGIGGVIQSGNVNFSNGNIAVKSANTIANIGAVYYSDKDLTFTANNLLNYGSAITTGTAGLITFAINNSIINTEGNIIVSENDLNVNNSGLFENSNSNIIGNKAISINSGSIDNFGGSIAAYGNLSISAQDNIDSHFGNFQSEGNISLSSQNDINSVGGVLVSKGNTAINAKNMNFLLGEMEVGNIDASGSLSGNLQITTTGKTDLTGTGIGVAGDLSVNATSIAAYDTKFFTGGNTSLVSALGDIDVTGLVAEGKSITINSHGNLLAWGLALGARDGDANIKAGGDIFIPDSIISVNGNVVFDAGGSLININGFTEAAQNLTANAGTDIINTLGTMQAKGNTTLKATGNITNTGGAVSAEKATSIEAGGNFANSAATIDGTGDVTGLVNGGEGVKIKAANIDNRIGLIVSGVQDDNGVVKSGKLELEATNGDVVLDGGTVTASDDINVKATGKVSNFYGLLSGNKAVDINAASLDNTIGRIQGQGNVTLTLRDTTTSLTNLSGGILSLDRLVIDAKGDLSNELGEIAGNIVGITSEGNIDNKSGIITGLYITAGSAKTITNTGAIAASNGVLLKADKLDNKNDIASTNVGVAAGTISNSGNIQSENAELLATGDLNNSGGIISTLLSIITGGGFNNSGSVTAGGLAVGASTLENTGSVEATQALIATTGNLTNKGDVTIHDEAVVNAGATFDNQGNIDTANNLGLVAKDILNSAILKAKNLLAQSGTFNNIGSIETIEETTIVTTTSTANNGAIKTKDAGLYSLGTTDNNGSLDISGNLSVESAGKSTNRSAINVAGGFGYNGNVGDASGSFDNQGDINASDFVAVTGSSINSSGNINIANNASIISGTDLTNSGIIEAGNGLLLSSYTLNNSNLIKAASAAINTQGNLTSSNINTTGDLLINSGGTATIGTAQAGGNIYVQGGNLVNNNLIKGSNIGFNLAALTNNGTLESQGDIKAIVTGDINSTGSITAGNVMDVKAANISSKDISTKDMLVDASGNVTTSGNTSVSGNTNIKAGGAFTNSGTASLQGDTLVTSGSFANNLGASFSISGKGGIETGEFANHGLASFADDSVIKANSASNTGLLSMAKILVADVVNTFANSGNINGDGDLHVKSANTSNSGDINIGGQFSSDSGSISTQSGSSITAENIWLKSAQNITNAGTLESRNDLQAEAEGNINDTGHLKAENGVVDLTAVDITSKDITAKSLLMDASGNIISNGNVNVSGTTNIDAEGNYTNSGNSNFSGDVLVKSANFTNNAGGNFNAAATSNIITPGSFTNNGTASFSNGFMDASSFSNSGTISTLSLLVADIVNAFTNSGNISGSGDLQVDSDSFTNNNNINIGGQLGVSAGNFTNQSAITAGSLWLDSAGLFSNNGNLTSNGTSSIEAESASNSGTINSADLLSFTSHSNFVNNGSVIALKDAVIDINNGNLSGSGLIRIDGDGAIYTTNFSGNTLDGGTSLLLKTNTYSNSASQTMDGDFALVTQNFTNSGSFNVGGSFAINDGTDDDASTLKFTNTGNVVVGGTLAFDGETYTNNGSLRAGKLLVSVGDNTYYNTGTLIVTGDHTINATGLAQNTGTIQVSGLLTINADDFINKALWTSYSASNMQQIGDTGIITTGNLVVNSTGYIYNLDGASMTASNNITLLANGNVDNRGIKRYNGSGYNRDGFDFVGSNIQGGGTLVVSSANSNINIEGSKIQSGSNMLLTARNNINMTAMTGSYLDRYETVKVGKSCNKFNCKDIYETRAVYANPTKPAETIVGGGVVAHAQTGSVQVSGSTVAAGADIVINAAKDIINESVVAGSPDYRSGFSYVGSQIAAGGDITLTAGENIVNSASSISAVGDIDMQAGNNITNEAQIGSYISSYVMGKRFKQVTNQIVAQGAEIVAGGNIVMSTASGDIVNKGSTISAGGDAYLVAARDVKLEALSKTVEDYFYNKNNSMFTARSYESGWTKSATLLSEVNADGDVVIDAGGNIYGRGARITAGHDISLSADGDVTFEAEQVDQYQWTVAKSSGFRINGLFGAVIDTVSGKGDLGSNLVKQIPILNAVNGLKDIESATDAAPWMRLGTQLFQGAESFSQIYQTNNGALGQSLGQFGMQQAGVTTLGNVPVPASFGFYSNTVSTRNDWTTTYNSALEAGNDATITGQNIFFNGSNLIAGRNARLDAVNDIVLQAVAEEYSSYYKQEDKSVTLTISQNSGSLGYNQSYQKMTGRGANYVPSTINAGGDAEFNAGGSVNVIGSTIDAGAVRIRANDVLVQTLQDYYDSKTTGGGFGFGVSVGPGYVVPSFSLSGLSGKESIKWSNTQAHIVGRDSVDIAADSLTLIGGKIANITAAGTDGGNLLIAVNELTSNDLYDVASMDMQSWGIDTGGFMNISPAAGGNFGVGGSNSNSAVLGGISYSKESSDKEGVTRATIGSGQILIGGQQATDEQLAGVNRDITQAQIVVRDEKSKVSFYIPVVDPEKFKNSTDLIKDVTQDIAKKLQEQGHLNAYQAQTAARLAEAMAKGEISVDEVKGCGGNTAFNLMDILIAPAYAGTCSLAGFGDVDDLTKNSALGMKDRPAEIREALPRPVLSDNFAGNFFDEFLGVPVTALNDLTGGWLSGGDAGEGFHVNPLTGEIWSYSQYNANKQDWVVNIGSGLVTGGLAGELKAATTTAKSSGGFFDTLKGWFGVKSTQTASTGTNLVPYYPSNNGFLSESRNITLQPGTLIDRYGPNTGSYVSPAGTPFTMRSLPESAVNSPYNVYEVIAPFEVQSGAITPAYGQLGLGTQHKLPNTVNDLVNSGYLRRK
jgi:adhesin HecA-like repeat protein